MALYNPSPYTAQILAELETQNLVNYHNEVPSGLFRAHLKNVYGTDSLSELGQLTSISLASKGLVNITGIEYAALATGINFNANDLSDVIDISGMVSLTSISFAINQLTDIGDLSALTGVTYLYLSTNQLTDIGDLSALTGLTYLNISVNGFTNIGSLSGMASMALCNLKNNQFTQATLEAIIDDLHGNRVALGALSCAIELQSNPGSTAAGAAKLSEINALIAAGCTVSY